MKDVKIEKEINDWISKLDIQNVYIEFDWSETNSGISYIDIKYHNTLYIIEIIPNIGFFLWEITIKTEHCESDAFGELADVLLVLQERLKNNRS